MSWSHLVAIVALKTPEARAFYAQRTAQDGWSVRELSHEIERKASERTEIAAAQTPALLASSAQVFKDPYFLDFLGLHQGHDEADLEAAILRQLEAFILELGRGFIVHRASGTPLREIKEEPEGRGTFAEGSTRRPAHTP